MNKPARKKSAPSPIEEQKRIIQKASPALNFQVGGEFTLIEDSERKQMLLRSTPHASQPSLLWTKDRTLKKKFFVKRFLEFPDQFEIEFADRALRVLGQVDEELDRAGTNDIYFNIRCEESSLFFHLPRRALSGRNGLLIVQVPTNLFEVQRRAQLRYRSTDGGDMFFTADLLKAWAPDLSVLDVSAGGVGLQIRFPSEELANQFSLSPELRAPFRLELGSFTFEAIGELRYFRRVKHEIDGEPVVRLGLRFVGLPQDTVEAIQLFVLENSYTRLRAMFPDG